MPEPDTIYQKFLVTRVEGGQGPGEKHEHCTFFVLDLVHDQHAIPAILAYAASCEGTLPGLASDLRQIAMRRKP